MKPYEVCASEWEGQMIEKGRKRNQTRVHFSGSFSCLFISLNDSNITAANAEKMPSLLF